jgi:hypothetical protein
MLLNCGYTRCTGLLIILRQILFRVYALMLDVVFLGWQRALNPLLIN